MRRDRGIERILISEQALQTRVRELAASICDDYADSEEVILIGILKGCMMFLVDLARAIDLPVVLDVLVVSSYGEATQSSGVVRVIKDLDIDITNRHVMIVEDIIDSGLTLATMRRRLIERNPASLRLCTLLDKPAHRSANVEIDYCGFSIPDVFVVGYGLDYAERYRNLPYIGVLAS